MRSLEDFHGYQARATTHLYEHSEVQAVMPMGSGKTACALTAIQELIRDGEIRHALVLAPKRVAQLVWPYEVKQWEHLTDLKVSVVVGSAEQRKRALDAHADVHVVGVDNVQWLIDLIGDKSDAGQYQEFFDLLVIDESSRFRNPRSKRAKALLKIIDRFKNRWELTGTPRPNGYHDQWMPLQLLTAGRLWPDERGGWVQTPYGRYQKKGFDAWLERYFLALDFHGYKHTIRPEWRDKIIADINSVSFTIDPAEMPDLPELVQVVHWVDLPPSVMVTYKKMEKDLLAKIVQRKGEKIVIAANAAVASGKLSQIAQGFLYDEDGNKGATWLHAAKSDRLVDLVDDLAGAPALICYQFVEDLRVLQDLWPGIPYLGAGVSDKQAAAHEAAWNRRELERFALHPASAGHGLNLQHGGNQMLHFGMPWSSEQFDQIRKRYWRQGQKDRCFEHIILAKNTIDEVKFDRVIGKMTDQEAFTKYLKKV